jgi:agmatine deiminase
MSNSPSPVDLGYRWPAEWEPHGATWVAWPHNQETWPSKYAPIPDEFATFVRTIARYEPVEVLAGGETAMAAARQHLNDVPRVNLWAIPTNDAWCRDHGPTFLQSVDDQPAALVDWQYNAWGNKYPPFDLDAAVPAQIAEALSYRRYSASMIVEGGAIDGNGDGTILTTASCLLNDNRNPGKSRHDIEQVLHRHLGVEQVLWLPYGHLAGDDTDGHVDQLARFVEPARCLAAVTEDQDDEDFAGLRENVDFLRSCRDRRGRRLSVIELPLPSPKFFGEHRLPASYNNFYIANGLVVVPQFDDPADAVAIETLRAMFADRDVIGLSALDLVWGLGAFHCLTQQQPVLRACDSFVG